MEFEEMQKIWDAQNQQTLYAINEDALYNRILSKKRVTEKITNSTELLLIIVNTGVAIFISTINSLAKVNLVLYALSLWMIATALYVVIGRIRRLKGEKEFGKTMLDELDQAIATASYQVRLSMAMRWNVLPVGVLMVIGLWSMGTAPWAFALIGVFFILAYYASGWEHGIYKRRKNELETLRIKLNSES